MEGIIVFIIIIVVLNILSRLMGGGKSRQAPPSRRRRLPEETWPERTKDRRSEYSGSKKPLPGYYEDEAKEVEDDQLAATFPDSSRRKKVKKEVGRAYNLNEQKTGSGRTTARLQQILSGKDSLKAAFIFHELLEPPLSVRKKRKKRGYH